jgi:hypothetical protein
VLEAVIDVAPRHLARAVAPRPGKASHGIPDVQPAPECEAPRQQERVDDSVEFGQKRTLYDAIL